MTTPEKTPEKDAASTWNTVEYRGAKWKIGTETDRGLAKAQQVRLAMAVSPGGDTYTLNPTLVSLSRDSIENYEIRQRRNGLVYTIEREQLPEIVLQALKTHADEQRLFGYAGDFSGPHSASAPNRRSHIIEVDGQRAVILQASFSDTPGKAAALQMVEGTSNVGGMYYLMPSAVSDEGKITQSRLFQSVNGIFQAVEDDAIPLRFRQEMEGFANRHQLFAKQSESHHERRKERIDTLVQQAMADSNLNGETAKLAVRHFETAMNEALEQRDFAQAKAYREQLRDYREAENALNKPASHHQRQAYEQREGVWQESAANVGSRTEREPISLREGEEPVGSLATSRGDYQLSIVSRKLHRASLVPSRMVQAKNAQETILLSPQTVELDGSIRDFRFAVRKENSRITQHHVSPEQLPQELVDAMRKTAEERQAYGTAGYYTARQEQHGLFTDSHMEQVQGQEWKFSHYQPEGAARPCAVAQRLSKSIPLGDPFYLQVQEVDARGRITKAERIYLQKPGTQRSVVAVPAEVDAKLKRFAETFQWLGNAMPGLEQRAQKTAESLLPDTGLDAGLAIIQLAAHEQSLAQAQDGGDRQAIGAAQAQVASHRFAVEKLSGSHAEREAFNREQREQARRNGDGPRFLR